MKKRNEKSQKKGASFESFNRVNPAHSLYGRDQRSCKRVYGNPCEPVSSGVTFSGGNTIHVIVNNSGTLDFAVSEVWVNDEKQAFTTNPSVGRIPPNECMELSVAYVYVNETSYHIKIVSDRTNEYFASATALVAGALPLRFSRLFVVVS